jgi:DNA-binding CsgD family transcriptional regulator
VRSSSLRNRTFDAVDEMSRLTSASEIAATLRRTVEASGYTCLGINGLPPPREGADPVILTEVAPEGFRDCYVEERFYLADHICNHARAAYEPFRFSEAPHFLADASRHKQFMQALDSFGLRRGLVVPIGRTYNIPACVWLAGENPDLHDDGIRAIQLAALFAASKALAITRPPLAGSPVTTLTGREREVLRWIAAGKTSWEIGEILAQSERTIIKIIAHSMKKLGAVTRTQAVVNAIRLGEIEL